MTCQCKIVQIIGAAVLLRHDMFEVMDKPGVLLVQPAIFATLAGPPPDEIARRRIHSLLNVRVQTLPRFELEDRDKICCVEQGLIF
jgi:hypothetical protein